MVPSSGYGRLPLLHIDILDLHAACGPQAAPRLFDTLQETRIMLQAVFEPVVLRFESNQHTGRLAMTVITISCVSASRR